MALLRETTAPAYLGWSRWPFIALSRAYDIRLGKMLQPQPASEVDRLTPFLKAAHVQWAGVTSDALPLMYSSLEEAAQYAVRQGDLLVCEGGDVGRAAILRSEIPAGTIIQNSLHRVRPRSGYSSRYLLYVLTAIHASGWFEVLCNRATIAHLTGAKLAALQIPASPLPEQRAIAAFLDRETARIDELVAKKRRLLDLADQRFASLVSEVVTRGPDAGTKLRASGVPGVGAIPEKWGIIRLRFLADVLGGVTKGRDLAGRTTVSLPYLRVANVQNGYLDLSDVAMIEVLPEEVGRYALREGDVLMNEGGDIDKLGRGAVWDDSINPCLHQNHVFAIRPKPGVDPRWLATITLARYAKQYFETHGKQSTNLASISASNLQELPVIFPPLDEQREILKRIEDVDVWARGIVTAIQTELDLIKGRRQALITAAVTGRIDVA